MGTKTRTVRVARTAHDLDHANRLHFPDFWIVNLKVSVGGKASKSYLTPDAPPPTAADTGTDNFHFAPEKETPDIEFELDDPYGLIEEAKLELFTRFQEDALWTLDLKKVGEDTYIHGEHKLKWDGRVIKDPTAVQAGTQTGETMGHDLTQFDADKTIHENFPDGYLTVAYPPYKFKLTVSDKKEGEADRTVRTAWTYFHILLNKIELELGDKKALPPAPGGGKPDLDALVYDDTDAESLNGSLPAENSSKKVILTSNIYKNSNGQMHDRSDFQAYETLWGDGPNIPVFAKAWVADSGDQPVEAPKALGKAKFLWDAEDVPEASSSVHGGHHAKAKKFIEKGVDYYRKTSKPKGDNCHKDRGGKRGDDTKFIFPKQDGYGYGFGGDFDSDPEQNALQDRKFPFKVVQCDPRKWSSYSYAWTKGTLASKTGVLFQPSRMAGDAYKLTVYLAYDRRLDKKDKSEKIVLDTEDNEVLKKVNKAIKATSGTFEIWRRLNFVKYMKKTATVTPNFTVATFQNYYKQAYVQVVYTAGAPVIMTKADFDAKVATAVSAEAWDDQLMFSTGSQYDAGDHALDFVDRAGWRTAVKAAKTWTDADMDAYAGTVLDTDAKYNAFADGVASRVLTKVCEALMDAADGINLFQFNEHYNLATAVGGSRLNGFAPGAAVGPKKADPTNTQCFFVLCAGTTNYGADSNTPEQTVTHEIGHCLFMAHAPKVKATDEANRHDSSVHDKDFKNCSMSYNYDAERKWCGYCLFRLRGWDRGALKNSASSNKKS
jgi:hypothetical protein